MNAAALTAVGTRIAIAPGSKDAAGYFGKIVGKTMSVVKMHRSL
jgi:hypothetical protein